MPSIKIPKAEMQELIYDKAVVVRDRLTGNGRWTIYHEVIFKRDGKLYRANYNVGATENQDEAPFEYSPDQIVCVEVKEVAAVDYAPVE